MLQVWTWDQELFDGSSHEFECVVRPDTASVIPFINRETVLLTRQTQPGREAFLDVPGGRVDPGEHAQDAALRELAEEAGKKGTQILAWHTIPHYGMVRFEEHLFLTSGLEETTSHLDAGEKIELFPVSWTRLIEFALERKLRQSNITLAILQMEFHAPSRARLKAFLDSGRLA